MRTSGKALRLVLETSLGLSLAIALCSLVAGLLPAALAYVGKLIVDAIVAEGGTNIELALTTALELLPEDGALNQVIFLTDGLPTEGVTEERALAALRCSWTIHSKPARGVSMRYCWAVKIWRSLPRK